MTVIEKLSEEKQKLLEQGCNGTHVIFPYPYEGDVLVIGEYEILCIKGVRDTGHTIFGLKVWVDETLERGCFYIVDANNYVASEEMRKC